MLRCQIRSIYDRNTITIYYDRTWGRFYYDDISKDIELLSLIKMIKMWSLFVCGDFKYVRAQASSVAIFIGGPEFVRGQQTSLLRTK